MLRHRWIAIVIIAALILSVAGCKNDTGGAVKTSAKPELPAAFEAADGGADLAITAEGAGVAVRSGDATAAVYVPAGAAKAGATWRVTPLKTAPAAATKALCPGVYVDTAGADPTAECSIGFSLPGTASPDACIVKLAEDGSVAEVMATTRVNTGTTTLLTAYVDGFSPYTTAEEDAAARDKAFQDRAAAKGQQVDWTIRATGKETQDLGGWAMEYELDLFGSGGDAGMGGVYNGHAMLDIKGTYTGPDNPYIASFGDIKAIGRDQKLKFTMVEASLTNLLTGLPEGEPFTAGAGVMYMTGMGTLNITALGVQGEKGEVNKTVEGGDPVAFTIKVTTGEDVQIEIPNVGIFPGKILRTTK